jgi:hypothetical protein
MRIDYPTSIDPYYVPLEKATRNAQQTVEDLTQLDLVYSIVELEKKVGILGPFDHYAQMPGPPGAEAWIESSHEYRITNLENAPLQAAGSDRELQFNERGNLGASVSLTFDRATNLLKILGKVGIARSASTYALEVAGHGFLQGPDGFNASGETAALYLGDSSKYIQAKYGTGIQLVVNQGIAVTMNEASRYSGFIEATSPATAVHVKEVYISEDPITDGYSAGMTLEPIYDGLASTPTITRHNYIDMKNAVLQNGPPSLTNACVIRFDAAAGTHKAVDSGTTKTSPGTVNAWIKVNINGTLYYIPSYTSKTT